MVARRVDFGRMNLRLAAAQLTLGRSRMRSVHATELHQLLVIQLIMCRYLGMRVHAGLPVWLIVRVRRLILVTVLDFHREALVVLRSLRRQWLRHHPARLPIVR